MGQAQSVQIPKRWPLFQSLYTRSPLLPITKDSRLVNGYVEVDPRDNELWVYKRPGVSTAAYEVAPNGFAGGAYQYEPDGQYLNIVNGFLYNGGTVLANVGNGLQCWFETLQGVPNQTVVVQNSYQAWIYTPNTQSAVRITDSNYPAVTTPGLAYLDGTLYVMDYVGNIWGTAGFDNAAVWDGLNVIRASSKADRGVFLATQLSYVIAMKQWTTQVFYDAANATGSPLGPVPDAQIPFGCLHPNSVQKMDEVLFWMTSNQAFAPQIVMMENLSPQIISTPSVERLLKNLLLNVGQPAAPQVGFDSTLFSWTLKIAGHKYYGLTCSEANFTVVFDVGQKAWYLWTDPVGNYWPLINFTYTPPTLLTPGQIVAQCMNTTLPTASSGSTYYVNTPDVYPNDFGLVPPVDIYTPNFSGGTTRRKTLKMMYFEADQTAGSILQARYSDDDYKSWSNFRSIFLSDEKPCLDQEGTFTKRAYHFRHACNTDFRIKASELQLDLGTL